jgi:hypothetical protein
MFFRRKYRQPLRARSPLFLGTSSIAGIRFFWGFMVGKFFFFVGLLTKRNIWNGIGYVISSLICLSWYSPDFSFLNCHVVHFVLNMSYPAYVLPYFFRAYRLAHIPLPTVPFTFIIYACSLVLFAAGCGIASI